MNILLELLHLTSCRSSTLKRPVLVWQKQQLQPLRWRRASREAAYVECCGHAVVQEATLSQLRWGGECLGGRVGRDGWLMVGLLLGECLR